MQATQALPQTGAALLPDRSDTEADTDKPAPVPILAGVITEAETARELNRCVRTLMRWRAARTGPPFIRIGKETYYRREAVRAWVLAKEQQPARSGRGRS